MASSLWNLLWTVCGAHVPRVELVKLKDVDFYPPPPKLSELKQICIGSKSRTIGDALMLTTLPALLKAKYPRLKVHTYPRAFNPVVFENNPSIDGVNYMPGKLYGDDCNLGCGQLIHLKEQYFELPLTQPPRPSLFLTPSETSWAKDQLGPGSQPIVIIHPWGKTNTSVLNEQTWGTLIREQSSRYRFFQVGVEGQPKIEGCENHLMFSRDFYDARKLMAVISQSQLFLGVDSGPMHIARAFQIPSWIATNFGKDSAQLFEQRHEKPYFLNSASHAFVYEENTQIDVTQVSAEGVIASAIQFLKKA